MRSHRLFRSFLSVGPIGVVVLGAVAVLEEQILDLDAACLQASDDSRIGFAIAARSGPAGEVAEVPLEGGQELVQRDRVVSPALAQELEKVVSLGRCAVFADRARSADVVEVVSESSYSRLLISVPSLNCSEGGFDHFLNGWQHHNLLGRSCVKSWCTTHRWSQMKNRVATHQHIKLTNGVPPHFLMFHHLQTQFHHPLANHGLNDSCVQ